MQPYLKKSEIMAQEVFENMSRSFLGVTFSHKLHNPEQ